MELKFEVIKMRKSNIPMDRAQKIDKKNWVICLLIMFTPEVMVMTMSNMVHLLYFLLITANYPNFDYVFAVISRKYKKSAIFYILMMITLEVNMITTQMTLFFLISFLSSVRCYILFLAFQDLKNSISWGPPFGLFLVWKIHNSCRKLHF